MSFMMPLAFPGDAFNEFGKLASKLFPSRLSDEDIEDPFQKQPHFQRTWLAVRYRYRSCSEHNEEFKVILSAAMADDAWREWSKGEEHHCRLEQFLCHFFMNALSVLPGTPGRRAVRAADVPPNFPQ